MPTESHGFIGFHVNGPFGPIKGELEALSEHLAKTKAATEKACDAIAKEYGISAYAGYQIIRLRAASTVWSKDLEKYIVYLARDGGKKDGDNDAAAMVSALRRGEIALTERGRERAHKDPE